MANIYKNYILAILFLATFNFFVLYLGYLAAGLSGILVAYPLAFILNGAAYWYGDKIILWAIGAEPMNITDNVRIDWLVKELAKEAGIPPPSIYKIPAAAANALAVGKDAAGATLVVSTGLMQLLDSKELRGVLAHEIVHIRNGDVLLNTIVAVIAGVFTGAPEFFDQMLKKEMTQRKFVPLVGKGVSLTIRIIFCPLTALLIHGLISQEVDYATDSQAAIIAGGQEGLASALVKLARQASPSPLGANPAFYHLYFIQPVPAGALAFLFNTHPAIEKRLARLTST